MLGEPGMGKTVALERMVWETTQADEPIIPVFVPLLFFQGDLIEAVRVALSEMGELHFDEPKTVRAFLRQMHCLIMFDGLNEVLDQQRDQIVGAIANFLREFPHHRYLITGRSQDELWKKLRATEVIKEAVVIQRITDEQARSYLMAHLGEQKGGALHDRLDDHLRVLSRIPLLLWLIKEAGKAGEALPGNRGELFDRFVNRMLERDEKLETKVERAIKKRALAHLAFSLQQTYQLACERERAVEIITPVTPRDDPKAVLQETLSHGLLQGGRKVGQRLLRRNLTTWARDDKWWAESFVLLAGLIDDPSWLVRELVSVKPWLAFWCSVEGKPVDTETRTLVEKKTIALLHSPEVEQRRQAVSELSHLENPRTIVPLVEALKDNDEGVVNLAVEALAKLGEPAVNSLLTALSGSEHTRWAATRTLGQIWGLADIVGLGDSENGIVRQIAALGLGRLGDIRAVEPLIAALKDSEAEVQRSADWALMELVMELENTALRAQAADTFIAALKDSNENVWWMAAWALAKLGGHMDSGATYRYP